MICDAFSVSGLQRKKKKICFCFCFPRRVGCDLVQMAAAVLSSAKIRSKCLISTTVWCFCLEEVVTKTFTTEYLF